MNNNQNLNTGAKHNGEGQPSSLSAVTRPDRNNEQLAQISDRRSGAPSGRRAEDYNHGKSLGASHGNNTNANQTPAGLENQRAINQQNAQRKMANLKQVAAQEMIKKYAAAHGVPEGVTQAAMESKAGQKVLDKALNKKSLGQKAMEGLLNRGGDTNSANKDESEKTLDEKSDDKEAKKRENGDINFEFSLKTIKWLIILTPVITSVMVFMLLIMAALNDEKTSSMVLAGMVAKEKAEEIKDEITGQGSGEQLGKAEGEFPAEYYERLSSLGNNYSSQKTCTGDECLERSEFLYYLKIADLSLRYKNKYSVDLDWYLISATNLYFENSTETTMKANLNGYNLSTADDYDSLSELDWDNDFKKKPGYQYLDADDSRYDLQILAKNMVKKKTIQLCMDSSGNVVSSQEDEDVEDMYFEEGGDKRLKCGAGQTYSKSSTYTKDLEKFDEFMLEYIDKKMYSAGSGKGNSSSVSGNNMSEYFVNLALEQLNDPSAHGGQKYWSHMGWSSRVAWCAAFVSWVIDNTEYNGTPLRSILTKTSSSVAEYMNAYYNNPNPDIKFYYNDNCSSFAGKNGSGKYTPKQGDLIYFDWSGQWSGKMPTCYECGPDHIGIVQYTENGTIYTIEGNSSDSVREKTYPLNSCQVIGFTSWY